MTANQGLAADATLELFRRSDAVLFGAAGTLDKPLPASGAKLESTIEMATRVARFLPSDV